MPRPPERATFSIGPAVDPASVTRWVAGTGPAGPARSSERTLLDTFDGRLHRRGLTLWREGARGAHALVLEGPAGAAGPAVPLASASADRLLGGDLPDGVVGQRLREALGERALLPRVRVRVRTTPLKVCNEDGKTVVRLSLEEPQVVGRGGPRPLGRRLTVESVLGYDREMERVVARLSRRLESEPTPLQVEALTAAGLDPRGVSSDVDVPLKPAQRADGAAAAICRRLADVVEVNLPGVLSDTDPEFLHDLRVAVRRSRSVLKEMRRVLAPDEAGRARDDLRWIQEITGPTRDMDVLLHDWPEMAQPVPEAMAADLRPLVELLQQQRQASFEVMRRHLRSRRFAVAWEAWRATISRSRFDGPDAGRPVGEMAAGRIRAVYRSMTRMGGGIDDSSPPTALHDMRKRGKELRYLLELFGGMWPADDVKPLVVALKGLQDVLGYFQDDEIQVHELRALGPAVAAAPGGTDSLIALGFVIEGLTVRQRQARHDFGRRFADFASPATRHIVERTFR